MDVVAGKRFPLRKILKLPVQGVKTAQSAIIGRNPYLPLLVFTKAAHDSSFEQRVAIRRRISFKLTAIRRQIIDAVIERAYPDATFAVFKDGIYELVGKCFRFFAVIGIYAASPGGTVNQCQTIVRPHQQDVFRIFADGMDVRNASAAPGNQVFLRRPGFGIDFPYAFRPRACPNESVTVFPQCHCTVRVGILVQWEDQKAVGSPIQPVQEIFARSPQVTFAVVQQVMDDTSALLHRVMLQLLRGRHIAEDALPACGNPHPALRIAYDFSDPGVDSNPVGSLCPESRYPVCFHIIDVHPLVCSQPQAVGIHLAQCRNGIGLQLRVAWVSLPVMDEVDAVETVQSAVRPYPNISAMVLQDVVDVVR